MASNLTPAERSLRAQLAVHTSWAQTVDRSARTAPARQAMLDKFEAEVPAEVTDPAVRAQMAESAKRAHFARMALKSAQSRRRRRERLTPDNEVVTAVDDQPAAS
jgi:hypothetical protein